MTGPSQVWGHWGADPGVLTSVALACALYARGAKRGAGRPGPFGLAVATLLVALASPLHAMADTFFAAHMVQHLLLVLVAAPLLAACRPVLVTGLGLPDAVGTRVRRLTHAPRLRRLVLHPLFVLLVSTGMLWIWHQPALYDAAVRRPAVHAVEHATLLASAVLFWTPVVSADRRLRADRGVASLLVFGSLLQSGALGALLTFAPVSLYASQRAGAALWGLTPLEDQQLAGALMWIPAGIVQLGVVAGLLRRWLLDLEARTA